MFERYTEAARRSLFFARYESSQIGATSIGTEHLLLGIARGPEGFVAEVFAQHQLTLEAVLKAVAERVAIRDKLPPSVEIPFGMETQRALHSAAEEADRLGHRHIGTEHLLLGILREPRSIGGSILESCELTAAGVRKSLAEVTTRQTYRASPETPGTAQQLDLIRQSLDMLIVELPHNPEVQTILTEIYDRWTRLRVMLGSH